MAGAYSTLDDEPFWTHEQDGVRVVFHELAADSVYVSEPASGQARANILFSHGFTDHAARHVHAHVRLAAAGYRVLTFDLSGHGGRGDEADTWWLKELYLTGNDARETMNEIARGVEARPGFRAEIAARQFKLLKRVRLEHHIDEILNMGRRFMASARYESELPVFLFGHSMGALACTEASRKWSETTGHELSGIVLASPALGPNGHPIRIELVVVEAVWKMRRIPRWLVPVSLVRPGLKQLMKLDLRVDTTWAIPSLSDLEIENDLYDTDPLTPATVPSSYVSTIEDQMVETDRATAVLPADTLLLLPERDGIVGVNSGLDFADRAAEEVGSSEQFTLTRFDGVDAHDLTRSSAADAAHEALVGWLEARSGSEVIQAGIQKPLE